MGGWCFWGCRKFIPFTEMEGCNKQERKLEEGERKGLHEARYKKNNYEQIKWINIAINNSMSFTRFV
jgi:hypothetical protein